MNNVDALKALFAALGGDPADVANAVTIVEVLNAIAAKFDGEDTATINPDAIANIAAVAGNIGGGGAELAWLIDRSIETITIPSSVTTIGSGAFHSCTNLTDITIPSSVTTIGYNAFDYCMSLAEIIIPSSVTAIFDGAFNGCTSLATITINKPKGSISGAPWGAPETTQIIWAG